MKHKLYKIIYMFHILFLIRVFLAFFKPYFILILSFIAISILIFVRANYISD
jgi:hypothetical protein